MVGRNLQEILTGNSAYELFAPSRQELNLSSFEAVKEYLSKNTPDTVIHCAGLVGGIEANIADPVSFLVENWEVGKNVVMASHESGVKKLINLGSSCMYPRNAKNPLSEVDILKGELEPTNEGYALAKISIAKLCEYISGMYTHKKYITLIPCNLYGKYDKFEEKRSHMIPAVIRKIHEAKSDKRKSVEIWGDGLSRREFMHVEDLVNFIIFSISNIDNFPSMTNVGIGKDYSINQYYKEVAAVIGYEGKFHHDLTRPPGMKQKLVDVSLANSLGWHSKIPLRQGIEMTYSYFLNEVL